jgi:hypothetical protein
MLKMALVGAHFHASASKVQVCTIEKGKVYVHRLKGALVIAHFHASAGKCKCMQLQSYLHTYMLKTSLERVLTSSFLFTLSFQKSIGLTLHEKLVGCVS